MTSPDSRAEVMKLEHLLAAADGELAFLAKADAAALRDLRAQITDVLFDSDSPLLQRVAVAAGKLPAAVVGRIAQNVFGPVLSARVAGLIETKKALELAGHVPKPFLTDIAVHIDPRRASDVIGQIPADRSVAVARELDRRGEYVPMARLVEHLSDDVLAACLQVVGDESLSRMALLVDDRGRLVQAIAQRKRTRPASRRR